MADAVKAPVLLVEIGPDPVRVPVIAPSLVELVHDFTTRISSSLV